MKTVLCYGDSNTWGYDADTGGRFGLDVRWPGVLRSVLGDGFHVIEEGLNGRTTVWDDPLMPYTNGLEYLRPCLSSHKPIDLVVLMLGSNDLKARFSAPAADIAGGVGTLGAAIMSSDAGAKGVWPNLLIVSPPPLLPICADTEGFAGGGPKSDKFAELYAMVADSLGCAFFDAGTVISSCASDGLHLTAQSHQTLGHSLADLVRQLIR